MSEIIKRGSERYKASDKLLKYAQEFWDACDEEGQYGAVQWVTGTNGELIIYTRGEYREQLMRNIVSMNDVNQFEEQMDRREDDQRDEPKDNTSKEG